MGQPHKHADVIKAWADGAEIEVRDSGGPWAPATTPKWRASREYRVKPDPYAHLRLAWRHGRVVQFRELDGLWVDLPPIGQSEHADSRLFSRAPERYRVKLEWQAERDAFAAGKAIQYRSKHQLEWADTSPPMWYSSDVGFEYRVKPDPYAHLRQAWREGKAVQVKRQDSSGWGDLPPPAAEDTDDYHFLFPPEDYRVKLEWQAERDAFAAGKAIQYRGTDSHEWVDCKRPLWLSGGGRQYRVKPDETAVDVLLGLQVNGEPLAVSLTVVFLGDDIADVKLNKWEA